MPESPKPRRVTFGRVLLALIIIGALGWGINWLLERHEAKRSSVDLYIPVDIKGDGSLELITVYGPPEYDTPALMEATNLASGERLWSREIREANSYRYTQGKRFVVGPGVVAISHRGLGDDNDGVGLYRLETGEEIWFKTLKQKHSTIGTLGLWLDNGLLIAGSRGSEAFTLAGYDLADGRLLWETDEARHVSSPLVIGDHLIFNGIGEVLIVNRQNGEVELLRGVVAETPLVTEAGQIVIASTPKGYKLRVLDPSDGSLDPHPAIGDDPFFPEHINPYNDLATYKEDFIVYQRPPEGPHQIIRLPLDKSGPVYKTPLPEGVQHRTIFYDINRSDPSYSPFYSFQSRYMPLLLRRSVDASVDELTWTVFDVEEGDFEWRGAPYLQNSTDFVMRQVLYHGGRHYISLPFHRQGNDARWALLIFDAETGRFVDALKVRYENNDSVYESYPRESSPWMLQDDLIFGANYDTWWAFDRNTLELVHTSRDDLVLESCLDEVEAVLGKLPR